MLNVSSASIRAARQSMVMVTNPTQGELWHIGSIGTDTRNTMRARNILERRPRAYEAGLREAFEGVVVGGTAQSVRLVFMPGIHPGVGGRAPRDLHVTLNQWLRQDLAAAFIRQAMIKNLGAFEVDVPVTASRSLDIVGAFRSVG